MRPPRDPRDDTSRARARAPDGKCDPAGRLWVGSKNLHCDKPTGALWSVDGTAEWTRHVEGVGVSNGLVWTRDRKTFYYIDSPTRTIDAFDYNVRMGTISNRRVAVRVKDGDGYPDGCAIDDEDKARVAPQPRTATRRTAPPTRPRAAHAPCCDHASSSQVWVAMWEGGCVIRYDPKSGKEMMRVAIPGAKQVTSCAFGGADLSTLYVTTASAGIPQAEIDREQPNAGALFAIDLKKQGVSGVPASAFKLPNEPKFNKKRARGV